MKSLRQLRQDLGPRAGLCQRCRFLRPLTNARGSIFVFCEKSREDPAFLRYPPLPVSSCSGFEEADGER